MGNKNLKTKILTLTLLLTLCLLTISTVNAATEHNITSSDDLSGTIANANNGDIINLANGTYKNNVNNITINKTITIQGKDPKTTIIDAQKMGRIFKVTNEGLLILKNITLANGYLTGNVVENSAGGAIIVDGGKLSVNNSIFTNNTGFSGGAILINNTSNILINNSVFINNVGGESGGSIYTYINVNYITIDNCDFTNNTARQGGAITSSPRGSHIIINNSNFTNNKSNLSGGSIYFWSTYANIFINNCIFTNSSGQQGGAINIQRVENFTINNCTFINNTATEFGGAIANFGHNAIINNTNFINNTVIKNSGGAIHSSAVNVTIDNCKFIGNIALNGTSAVNGGSSSALNLTIINSNFTNNIGGEVIYISSNYSSIKYCNIFNNQGAVIIGNIHNITVNFNRIFNNTNNSEYDLENYGNLNADYNWWGSNTPQVYGTTLNNYFIMNVTNLTSLNSNGTVTFNYTFRLNTDENVDNSLLPYFVTNVYTNVTDEVITSFDARFDNTFDVTVNTSGDILYTFITDNEVQTLAGKTTIPDPIDPVDPVDPIDPTPEDNNKTSNNPTANATMKETGMPINLILIILLSVLGVLIGRKQN